MTNSEPPRQIGCVWPAPAARWDMFQAEILTTAEMIEAERLAMAAGTPAMELMERAGAGVADAAATLAREAENIAIVCGPGNNGGDGFVAGRLLRERGYTIHIGLLGDRNALRGDAAEAARRWAGEIKPASSLDLNKAGLVIDALFGSGLSRDLGGEARALVEKLNAWRRASRRPVVSVDVPSGLDADTGAVRGAAVEATATVTFFRLRPGHLLLPGRGLCGALHVCEIGIPETTLGLIKPQTFANVPALWRDGLPLPAISGHKYSRGHVLVVSGGPWSTGAARLAARGALRAGAGLVTLASPREALTINASQLTAIMLAPCDGPEELTAILNDPRFNAVVLGPGLGVGEATRALVRAALESNSQGRSVLLDADALTSFAGSLKDLATCIRASKKSVIFTPHEGEFAKLFKAQAGEVESKPQTADALSQARPTNTQAGKLNRVRTAAARAGATVVLKGPDTVIARPDGKASIAFDAPPWLATAGSGDVLAGIIAGLSAQGMDAFGAASAGCWLHSDAARAFGAGLIAEDLPEQLPGVLRGLLS